MNDWRTELPGLVRAHLPAHVADAFDALPLRPAVALTVAEPGDPVVGQLGGAAALPVGHEWPLLTADEPLTFVARLDFAALRAYDVDPELPGSGSLLFFLPPAEEVTDDCPAPVIHVPDGTATADQQVPAHLRHPAEQYDHPLVPLTARSVLTAPGAHHPALGDDPAVTAELSRLLWRETYDGRTLGDIVRWYRGSAPHHQVGGYSDAFQSPLEIDAASRARRTAAGPGHRGTGSDPRQEAAFLAEARQWVTLLQLDEDTDAGMGWGDGGIALWAIRRDDLAARNFAATYFTVDGH